MVIEIVIIRYFPSTEMLMDEKAHIPLPVITNKFFFLLILKTNQSLFQNNGQMLMRTTYTVELSRVWTFDST